MNFKTIANINQDLCITCGLCHIACEDTSHQSIAAERKDKMRPIFRAAVALLLVVQLGLFFFGESLGGLALWLLLFFVAFNVLAATLPSLVSRTAPPAAKGAALGVYNTTQAMGLFIGGAAGVQAPVVTP